MILNPFKPLHAISKNSRVAALSRAVIKDIDAAAEALKVAEAFRIHTFIAVSALHVEAKLKRTFDDVVEMAVAAVKHARNYTDDVEFFLRRCRTYRYRQYLSYC